MMQIKRIISWLTRLMRNRSQAEKTNIIVKNDVYVNQKIVVIVKDHNNQHF